MQGCSHDSLQARGVAWKCIAPLLLYSIDEVHLHVQSQLKDNPGLRIKVEGVDDQCFNQADRRSFLGNVQFVALVVEAPRTLNDVWLLKV